MKRTYLELSQAVGAHKFYEVIVDGKKLKIRYGRIGTDGTKSEKEFASEEAAEKEANKKINAKKKKGYADAVMGVRKKRAISRRSIPSGGGGGSSSRKPSKPQKSAPVLWKFDSGSAAFGIYIDDDHCWVGNEAGRVFKLDHDGQVINQYQLPNGVKCIIADQDWIYVGCDDGNVYDLTGKVARIAYEINENIDIYWLDISNGLLGVSDRSGNVTTINHEDEEQWTKKSKGTAGWMVRCDEEGKVYHGHSGGVTCYNGANGEKHWHQATKGSVLFGWRMENTVLTGSGSSHLELFDNEGKRLGEMKADRAVYSCASSPNNDFIFGGDSSAHVYCFDKDEKRLWKLATTCGSAYSMQYHNEKLYIVTTHGTLTCIDASETAIKEAQEGKVPEAVKIAAPKAVKVVQTEVVETVATNNANGIIVKCVKVGSKLRVRVLSDGFKKDWNVQFPKNLRAEGAEFVVDELRESSGGFYRVYGNIYRLGG